MVKLAVWSSGSMVNGASNCMIVTRLSGARGRPTSALSHTPPIAVARAASHAVAEGANCFTQAGVHFNSFRAASTVVRTIVGSVTVFRYSWSCEVAPIATWGLR